MKRSRCLLVLALAAAPAGLGLVWTAGSVVARPFNRVVLPPDSPAETVGLVASDGVALTASYWPGVADDSPAILLLHGFNQHRGAYTRQAQWLHGLGYAVLALDFRGHGGSAVAERTFGWREAEDAKAALLFLRAEAPRRKVGVIGVSMGGAAALLGREGPLPVEALVLQGVYSDIRKAVVNRLRRSGSPLLASWTEPLLSYQSYFRYGVPPERISPVAGIRRFEGSVMVIGGVEDRDTTVADTRALYAAAPGPKALWLMENINHHQVSRLWTEEYRARVRCLFARTLGEPKRHDAALQTFHGPCAISPSFSTGSFIPARAMPS